MSCRARCRSGADSRDRQRAGRRAAGDGAPVGVGRGGRAAGDLRHAGRVAPARRQDRAVRRGGRRSSWRRPNSSTCADWDAGPVGRAHVGSRRRPAVGRANRCPAAARSRPSRSPNLADLRDRGGLLGGRVRGGDRRPARGDRTTRDGGRTPTARSTRPRRARPPPTSSCWWATTRPRTTATRTRRRGAGQPRRRHHPAAGRGVWSVGHAAHRRGGHRAGHRGDRGRVAHGSCRGGR